MRTLYCTGLVLATSFLLTTAAGCTNAPVATDKAHANKMPVLSGPYLGQEPPGMTPVLFSPGIVSTGMDELNAVFLPGGKELFYSVTSGRMKWALVTMREESGRWTPPEVAPFSGVYGDVDPCVSPDGKRLYFCSNRPRSGEGDAEDNYDIWYVEKTGDGWSAAVNIGPPVNSDSNEFYPSFTGDGTIYFQSWRQGGIGETDIYRSRLTDGRYVEVECLPEPVNSAGFEGDAFIAPDESYIIVSTYRENDNHGSSDLYISFRDTAGGWSELINMGPEINSPGGENCQILSPCGKYLFFTSRRSRDDLQTPLTYKDLQEIRNSPLNGGGDIFWVDARIIERFRPK
jgi:Tol biopolymer transport system component